MGALDDTPPLLGSSFPSRLPEGALPPRDRSLLPPLPLEERFLLRPPLRDEEESDAEEKEEDRERLLPLLFLSLPRLPLLFLLRYRLSEEEEV